jgi:hypothetical protein
VDAYFWLSGGPEGNEIAQRTLAAISTESQGRSNLFSGIKKRGPGDEFLNWNIENAG